MSTIETIQAEIEALESQKTALETEYESTQNALAESGKLDHETVAKLPTLQATLEIIGKRLGLLKQDKAASELDAILSSYEDSYQQSFAFFTEYSAKKEKIEQLQQQLNDLIAETSQDYNLHYQLVILPRQKLYTRLLQSPDHKKAMNAIMKKYRVGEYL